MTTEIDRDGQTAEDAVAAELRADGWKVLNLNRDIAGNYPVIDLSARRDDRRMLIQVRGTRTDHGSFRTPPGSARKAEALSDWLGLPVLYAFVHFADETPVVRYETASRVADLAEEDEASYLGTNRYHVDISQFDIDIKHLRQFLRNLRRRQFLRGLRKFLSPTH
jgi:hypothetical protein